MGPNNTIFGIRRMKQLKSRLVRTTKNFNMCLGQKLSFSVMIWLNFNIFSHIMFLNPFSSLFQNRLFSLIPALLNPTSRSLPTPFCLFYDLKHFNNPSLDLRRLRRLYHCDLRVSRSQGKIYENFANNFLKTKASNKCFMMLKCKCKGLQKSISGLEW